MAWLEITIDTTPEQYRGDQGIHRCGGRVHRADQLETEAALLKTAVLAAAQGHAGSGMGNNDHSFLLKMRM